MSSTDKKKPSLAGIVVAKNAEKTLENCLKSLSFTDEIIVVIDDSSQDATETIARRYTDNVYIRPWPGYGKQKNFALSQTNCTWALFLDADEEVTFELQEHIQEQISTMDSEIYWIRIVTVFLGRPLYHLYGHNPRLFRTNTAEWTQAKVHEQLKTKEGKLVKFGDEKYKLITSPILHYSHETIASYLKKMHLYTTLDATQMHKTMHHRSGKPVRPSTFLPYYLSLKQFVKMYFYKKGFLDGFSGLIWSILSSYYEWEMGKKFNQLAL